MIKNTTKNFFNAFKNILAPISKFFLNFYLFKIISMCINEFKLWYESMKDLNYFSSYYYIYPNYKKDKNFILYEDYKYDNFDMGRFLFFIKTYPLLSKEYAKKFNLDVYDDLFFYVLLSFFTTKLGYPIQNTLHRVSYKFYLLCKAEPLLAKDFERRFLEYLHFEPISPNFDMKVVDLYHTARKLFSKEVEPYTPNANIRYNSTSLVKNINDKTDFTIYFLRKNKSFNKGRYSRNRQNYRTGVYWCLYVNIIALFGLYYYFYRFSLNFGYLWWLFFCLPASFIAPQVIKNRLYNPFIFFNAVVEHLEFLYNCICIIFFKKK